MKKMGEFDEIYDIILKFRKEREWEKFHSPKNLAVSISLEAAELLEIFQWDNSGVQSLETAQKRIEEVKDEIADILVYSMFMAKDLNIDIKMAIKEKMEKNALKYPVEKARGSSKKYNQL
jgi:NTP pyrophosphatase (non-canonical NTP hydrolase)